MRRIARIRLGVAPSARPPMTRQPVQSRRPYRACRRRGTAVREPSESCPAGGFGALIAVPLLARGGRARSRLNVTREDARRLRGRRRSSLLQTFASPVGAGHRRTRACTMQLEEASRHKSQFLANMCHELGRRSTRSSATRRCSRRRPRTSASSRSSRTCADQRGGQAPAGADQRHPRPLQDRGRQHGPLS